MKNDNKDKQWITTLEDGFLMPKGMPDEFYKSIDMTKTGMELVSEVFLKLFFWEISHTNAKEVG